jgi:predicted Zn-dependent protease
MKLIRCLLVVLWVVSLPVLTLAEEKDAKKKPKKEKDDVEAIGERDVDGSVNFYSIDKEIALGKQLADEVDRTAKVVDDPLVAEYINRLGQNLARNSDGKVPFSFKVVDDPAVNAFALPGGFLFVHTGLILQAETEGELAGVLAHEIAHVAARHGTRQATRGQLANLATIPLIFMGGWTGFGVRQAASLAIPMGFLQFSRKFEAEADFLGLQYLYASGYDPISFVDFFERLQAMEKRKPGSLASVFRSHPMTDDRIESAQKEIERILPAKAEYVVSSSEFLDVRDRLSYLLSPAAKEDPDLKTRPRMRRTTRADTGTVERPGSSQPSETTGDDDRPVIKRRGTTESEPPTQDDDRPVIRRQDPTASQTGTPQEPASEDDRPVLRREGSEPEPTAPVERPTTVPASPPEPDDNRPVLKRKN